MCVYLASANWGVCSVLCVYSLYIFICGAVIHFNCIWSINLIEAVKQLHIDCLHPFIYSHHSHSSSPSTLLYFISLPLLLLPLMPIPFSCSTHTPTYYPLLLYPAETTALHSTSPPVEDTSCNLLSSQIVLWYALNISWNSIQQFRTLEFVLFQNVTLFVYRALGVQVHVRHQRQN